MNIAFDITPISDDNSLHAVRGAGFYIRHLKDALKSLKTSDTFHFFLRGENIQNADIIHYPYFEPFFLTLPIRKKIKTVVTVHDLTPLVFPKLFPVGIKGKLKWNIQKMALKKADAVIADSQSSKRDIAQITEIPESKVHVIYLAADSKFQIIKNRESKKRELKKKYNLPEKFVLYVGDVTPNKNLPRLVSAIKKTAIPLVLVGKALTNKNFNQGNPWNQDLAIVQNEIKNSSQFRVLGYVNDEDLIKIYNLASLFVFPSLYEGFGLPVLEAMQSGCPVITSRKGSLAEVAGSAAEFIDPYDENSIVEGIAKVFEDKKLQETLISKGLAQAKKFSWEKTAQKTIEVYKTVLSI